MRIAVLGTGHMGSWFIHEFAKNHEVAVHDIDRGKMDRVKGARPLIKVSELQTFHPQILLNAVTLKHTIEAFNKVVEYLPQDCLIADIASIKGQIPLFYRQHNFPFVSIHPMFGPHFADLNQLSNENVILITESDQSGKDFFTQFFQTYNLRLYEHSFSRHDELMAESLALPFATSLVFAATITADTVPGTTYAAQKSIARKLLKEDDSLISEVLFNPAALPVLDKVSQNYEFLIQLIKTKDYDRAGVFFEKLRKSLK